MIRGVAKLVSFLCHPLLILTYILVLLLLANPYPFGDNHISGKKNLLFILVVFLSTFVLPVISIFLMKGLGMVHTMEMKDNKERIGPYIASGIFYLWTFQNFVYNPQMPLTFKIFMLGATIALFVAFFLNNFSRISTYTVGMGAWLGMILIAMSRYYGGSINVYVPEFISIEISMISVFMWVLILAGLVGSARFFLGKHEPMDVYGGYFVGFAAQFIALRILV